MREDRRENLPSELPKGVLFDWDNTLVDTWPVIHDAMNATLAAMGHPLWTLADTRQRVRRALREAFPDMFGDRWEEARDVFYDRFREIHLERLEVCSGAESLLKLFQERGVYLGVVSNKSGDHLRREAEYLGWEGYFSRLVGATDAEKDKPALDPVLMALKPGELAPGRNIWFVGDTKIDMECAHIANCIPVLVAESRADPADFGDFMPHYQFSSLEKVADLVSRL
jgi:phosphoglycolate phosphatase